MANFINKAKIRVMVVDDSAVMRQVLTHFLQADPEIEVVATAIDPFDARKKLIDCKPDVITLDIEMPRMDGLTFLEKLMEHYPTPTIVVSTLAAKGSQASLRALELGAIATIEKPVITSSLDLKSAGTELIAAVKTAKTANIGALSQSARWNKSRPQARIEAIGSAAGDRFILCIGASTGGTEAIKSVVLGFPKDMPPIVIVQHMPATFTKHFANRLNELAAIEVKEAQEGDLLRPGLALLAPGDFHMRVLSNELGQWCVRLNQEAPMHGVRPAVDILMSSVAKAAGTRALGVILTGMGKDGALGLKEMREAGARTIAQDEASCVVYGMPKAAFECGAVEKVLPLNGIAEEIVEQLQSRSLSTRSNAYKKVDQR